MFISDLELACGVKSNNKKIDPSAVQDFYGIDMTRITSLGMKRSYKDAQFNSLFVSGEQEAIAEAGGNTLNEDEEGPAKKKSKRSKDDVGGVQTSPSVEGGVGKSKNWGKKRFMGKFSRAKTDGAPCCSHT
jgi:hypothetical protein